MSFRFPLATSSWDNDEYAALQRVIDTGRFSMGNSVADFEKGFADYIGSKYCVMVNSGSSANLLMIAALRYTNNPALRIKPGDEVIVPAVSWSTTYYPLHQYGLKIKFVDIDMQTLNYDLDQLSAAISDKTRLLFAVNLLGNPNDFKRVNQLIEGRDIILIEDNCESMGAEIKGRKTGGFGVMGSFSSFFSHHISTMEGGMINTDDEELYHVLLSLRAHGWTRNLPKHNHVCGEKSDDPFKESFHFVLPGYNVRPLEMSGALGLEQLKKLPFMVEQRRKNARLMQSALTHDSGLMLQQETGSSSWFGFSLVIHPDSAMQREDLLPLLNQQGFECRPIVSGNFANNEVVEKYFDFEIHGALHHADYIDRSGIMIGNHHYSMQDAADVLAEMIASPNYKRLQ
ncbi:MAG: DegT/DnrJ/EryC1/StrS family aminotransferase [Gammaproteobacteria bacterium]|nr:DegT/DnrJ/EryC1/StrS family aminotransferase [Gammaproteobacteria bacterium]